jgi:acetyl-CoA carboxylase carboxyltransferase component
LYRIESQLNIHSPEFLANREAFLKILEEYQGRLRTIRQGASPMAIQKHVERGKLLARERIDMLVDPNTPFLELSPLAAYGMYENQFPSAGIITGIGVIHGRETVIIANDATVKGGTYMQETIKKHVRAQEIAMENHLPCVYMVDSGGGIFTRPGQCFSRQVRFRPLLF